MTNDLTKLGAVPEYLVGKLNDTSGNAAFSSGMGGNKMPQLTYEGRKWAFTDPNGKELEHNSPTVDAILIAANPSKSRVYYASGFTEQNRGAVAPCQSIDGLTPSLDSPQPQAKSCQLCPKRRKKGEPFTGDMCRDYRYLAVITTATGLEQVLALKIPPASLTGLSEYMSGLTTDGFAHEYVVTRLSFDPKVKYPRINFELVRFVNEKALAEVEKHKGTDAVLEAIRMKDNTGAAVIAPNPALHGGVGEVPVPINQDALPPPDDTFGTPPKSEFTPEPEPTEPVAAGSATLDVLNDALT